ncbi:hypothetical protein MPER_11663 [Moniliophthora perniciosa FA553]|nr:hypothetical protein MPER_11663 [Moniliophthora perniciosa FA553]
MPAPAKKRRASESNYQPPGSFYKRSRVEERPHEREIVTETPSDLHAAPIVHQDDCELDMPTSSAPGSPRFYDDKTPPPIDLSPAGFARSFFQHLVQQRSHTAPHLPTPYLAAPASSPLSILNPSPTVLRRGRRRVAKPHRNPRGVMELKNTQEWKDKQAAERAQRAADEAEKRLELAQKRQAERRARREAEEAAKLKEDTNRAQSFLKLITTSSDSGGFGFESLIYFFERALDLESKGDSIQARIDMTKFLQDHGARLTSMIFQRGSDDALEEFLKGPEVQRKLNSEGRAIQKLLSREKGTKMQDLLAGFNMEDLERDLRREAPIMWDILTNVGLGGQEEETRRKKELVSLLITMAQSSALTYNMG